MIAVVWQFDVRAGRSRESEEFFGADGEWTALNRQSRSFVGSSFLKDQNLEGRYLLIEYWSEMLVYEEHRAFRHDQIKQLSIRRDALVESFQPLGVFSALNVPDRTGPAWSRRRQS
jgi:hypothetical protein